MRAILHADPYSGHEVLVVETPDGILGVAYDPRRASSPIPWSASCPHCRAGRLRGPSPGTSRLLRMLVSRRTIARPRDLTKRQARVVGTSLRERHLYDLPTAASHPTQVIHWRRGRTQHAVVTRKKPRWRWMKIAHSPERPMSTDKASWHVFQSPILRKCLRFLFSGRPATREEIAACLRPLVSAQLRRRGQRRPRGGRRLPCKEIDWLAILKERS